MFAKKQALFNHDRVSSVQKEKKREKKKAEILFKNYWMSMSSWRQGDGLTLRESAVVSGEEEVLVDEEPECPSGDGRERGGGKVSCVGLTWRGR